MVVGRRDLASARTTTQQTMMRINVYGPFGCTFGWARVAGLKHNTPYTTVRCRLWHMRCNGCSEREIGVVASWAALIVRYRMYIQGTKGPVCCDIRGIIRSKREEPDYRCLLGGSRRRCRKFLCLACLLLLILLPVVCNDLVYFRVVPSGDVQM